MKKLNFWLSLSIQIILVFAVAILMSFAADKMHPFFDDIWCTHVGYNGHERYELTHAFPTWHWGYRHWLWMWLGVSLAVAQLIRIIVFIFKEVDKN